MTAAARSATTPDIGADEFAGTKPADITLTPDTPICDGSSLSLNASSTDLTYVYTWSPATGLSATTGASVIANPIVTTTYTVTGTAPSSCVKLKDVTITVNPIPAAITVSPATANICPNAIQSFTASSNIGTFTVGTVTALNSAAANTPYRATTISTARRQYLISKAELNAANFFGGTINSLAFNITILGSVPTTFTTYTINVAHTSVNLLNTVYQAPAFTTVFSQAVSLISLGYNTHNFTTPFVWDGTSNLLIEICHSGPGVAATAVSVMTPTNISTTSNSGATACTTSSFAATNADRPVMRFGFVNPVTWSPATELYIDATATTAYNALTYPDLLVVYTKPTIPRVYTATSTNASTGCTQNEYWNYNSFSIRLGWILGDRQHLLELRA